MVIVFRYDRDGCEVVGGREDIARATFGDENVKQVGAE
jgi:hypothetical protein